MPWSARTGLVGSEMLNILSERHFPVDDVVALASRRSIGVECQFGDRTLKVQDLENFDFSGWDMAFFSIGSAASQDIRAESGGRSDVSSSTTPPCFDTTRQFRSSFPK